MGRLNKVWFRQPLEALHKTWLQLVLCLLGDFEIAKV